MRGSMVVLAGLVVVAVVLTVVGAVQSDAWTGERTYAFTPSTVALPEQGPSAAGSAPARFEWPAPANATGLHVNVTVAFTGQAVQGGSAVVRVAVIAPDGRTLPSVTRSLAIAAGASSATLSLEQDATWAAVPATVRDTHAPAGLPWDAPVVVLVSVDRPSDLPVANYAFAASVTATAAVFAA